MLFIMQCLNEEDYVERCLSDYHDLLFVEGIIVIDGGSTDYTVHELKKFKKVKVFTHPWLDWYHDMNIMQRNIALSYVPKGKFCFMLDFDERLSDPLKKFLFSFHGSECSSDLVNVPRKTFELLRYPGSPYAIYGPDNLPVVSHQIGQYPDYQPRLIRRKVGMVWANSPHHVLMGWGKQEFLPEGHDILHFEKDDSRSRLRIEKKWARAQSVRKELGLAPDVFETTLKPEVASFSDPEAWK
jgi:glycosyltransferase involved in cell wall biosynthesis